MNVMILAAGEGTRLRPYTLETPKPAIPFLSVPLACYSLALLDGLEIDRLVVNTFHLPQQIRTLFQTLRPTWKDLQFSNEETHLLGSGGGIHKARKHLEGREDFLVINGDEVILPHEMGVLQEMLAFHRWHKGIATLLTMDHPEVGERFGGAWLGPEGTRVQCFSKKNPGPEAPRGQHFVGTLLLSDKVFRYFKPHARIEVDEENILYETLTAAMAAGEEVHTFNCKAEWFETGNPVDFMKATESCLDHLSQPNSHGTYWIEYLKQTIRLHSRNQFVIERDWSRFSEMQPLIQKIKRGF
jgi:mannose-1-phosphate guanylyltransferase